MKYFIAILVTAVLVFAGATVYYKGLPNFVSPGAVSDMSTETPEISTSDSTNPPTDSEKYDEVVVIEAIEKLMAEKYGEDPDREVTVSGTQDGYAKGGVTSGEVGGAMWIAAELNGSWSLVYDGQGVIECDLLTPHPNLPISMVSECWDSTSNTTVTR